MNSATTKHVLSGKETAEDIEQTIKAELGGRQGQLWAHGVSGKGHTKIWEKSFHVQTIQV